MKKVSLMPKKKTVRKKTTKELADPKFRRRVRTQTEVLKAAIAAADRVGKRRKALIEELAGEGSYLGADEADYEKSERQGKRMRNEFLRDCTNPLELHLFSLKWNYDRGPDPIKKIVSHPHCDAGTALRIYWINDPYYYSEYGTVSECEGAEKDWLSISRKIERRFKKGDFATAKIPFDPEPWLSDQQHDWQVHEIPEVMYHPIEARTSKKRR